MLNNTEDQTNSQSMIILQIDTNSPLLFMDPPEDNLATGHHFTNNQGNEGNGEKRKKKKHKGRDIEGDVMMGTAEMEMAVKEKEQELGVEQGLEQGMDRKKRKKEKKKLKRNESEALEQEEHIPQERGRTKTSCVQSEGRGQCETVSGTDNGAEASKPKEQASQQAPREVLLQERAKKKRREKCIEGTELSIHGETEDGTETYQQDKSPQKKKKKCSSDQLSIQSEIQDGAESSWQEVEIPVQTPQVFLQKTNKRRESGSERAESKIQAEIEDGTEPSKHEEEIPKEVLQGTKKRKKKSSEANSDQTGSKILGKIEDDTASSQHEDEIPKEVLLGTKKRKKKRREANGDQTESKSLGEIKDGTEISQHEDLVLQEIKKTKKKKRESHSDQTESNVKDKFGVFSGTSKQQDEITEGIPQGIRQEKKRKTKSGQTDLSIQSENEDLLKSSQHEKEIPLVKNGKKSRINCTSDQIESSIEVETMAGVNGNAKASSQSNAGTEISKRILLGRSSAKKITGERSTCKKQLGIQEERMPGVKNGESQTKVFMSEQGEYQLNTEKWEEDNIKSVEELKEFIPSIEKKSTHSVQQLLKYDLSRFREFKKAGVGPKHGRYTAEEVTRLKRNVEDFLALTGIDSGTKLFFPSRFPEEKTDIIKLKIQHKFYLRISDGICRPWHDIYTKGRKLFDDCRKGRFTDDEINSLLKLQQLHGNKWTMISEQTDRSSSALEKHYSQMSKNKGPWSEGELQSLEKAIKDHVVKLSKPGDNGPTVRRDHLYTNLPWTQVAHKVGTRSGNKCRLKWMNILNKRMSGMEDHCGYDTLPNSIRFIRELYALEIEDVAAINWEDLTKVFGDVTPHFVQTKFHRLKVKWVPNWPALSFGEIIDFLYEKALPQLEMLHTPERETECFSTQQESFLLSEIFGDA